LGNKSGFVVHFSHDTQDPFELDDGVFVAALDAHDDAFVVLCLQVLVVVVDGLVQSSQGLVVLEPLLVDQRYVVLSPEERFDFYRRIIGLQCRLHVPQFEVDVAEQSVAFLKLSVLLHRQFPCVEGIFLLSNFEVHHTLPVVCFRDPHSTRSCGSFGCLFGSVCSCGMGQR